VRGVGLQDPTLLRFLPHSLARLFSPHRPFFESSISEVMSEQQVYVCAEPEGDSLPANLSNILEQESLKYVYSATLHGPS